MGDSVRVPDDADRSVRTITDGPFEHESALTREEAATFLRQLADQVEDGTALTLESSAWELPFAFREPIEVEVELEGGSDRELEIEFEFAAGSDGSDLSIQ